MNINAISTPAMPAPTIANASAQEVQQSFAAKTSGSGAPITTQAVAQAGQPKASQEELENATKKMNDFVQTLNSAIEFSVDKDTDTTVVKVIDTSTKEVLRQIPSEEMLAISKAIDKVKGLLVHQKA